MLLPMLLRILKDSRVDTISPGNLLSLKQDAYDKVKNFVNMNDNGAGKMSNSYHLPNPKDNFVLKSLPVIIINMTS